MKFCCLFAQDKFSFNVSCCHWKQPIINVKFKGKVLGRNKISNYQKP